MHCSGRPADQSGDHGAYDAALWPFALRISQANIPSAISHMGKVRPTEVSRILRIEMSTLSRDVELMKQKRVAGVRTAVGRSEPHDQPPSATYRAGHRRAAHEPRSSRLASRTHSKQSLPLLLHTLASLWLEERKARLRPSASFCRPNRVSLSECPPTEGRSVRRGGRRGSSHRPSSSRTEASGLRRSSRRRSRDRRTYLSGFRTRQYRRSNQRSTSLTRGAGSSARGFRVVRRTTSSRGTPRQRNFDITLAKLMPTV